jgi:hypothetical protein
MGKKGDKARLKGREYHSNLDGLKAVFHNRADCLGGSKIRKRHLKPGAGQGRTLCGVCARRSA